MSNLEADLRRLAGEFLADLAILEARPAVTREGIRDFSPDQYAYASQLYDQLGVFLRECWGEYLCLAAKRERRKHARKY